LTAATAGLPFSGAATACLPDENSRTQASPGGKYLLVMVSPLPVADDKGNRPLDPARGGARLRDKYRKSGLYRNDGSSQPLWPIPFTDGNLPAHVAPDGTCVVFDADPCDLGPHAVTVYAKGRHVATYLKPKLIPCYNSKELLGRLYDRRGVEPMRGELDHAQRTYTITTEQGEVFVLDVTDGRVVRHVSPWTRRVVAFTLLVSAVVVLVWYRPWIRRGIWRAGGSPPQGETNRPLKLTWKRFSLRGVLVGITLLCVVLAFRKHTVLGAFLGIPAVIAGVMTLFFRRSFRSFFVGGILGCYGCIFAFMLADLIGGSLTPYGAAPAYVVLSASLGGLLLGAVVAGIAERNHARRECPPAFTATRREDGVDTGNSYSV
jgi:uncharacterized membrane protein HdeD (DUF308 family)